MRKEAMIESVLIDNPRGMSLSDIANILDFDEIEVGNKVKEIKQKYDNDDSRGMTVVSFDNKYKFCSKESLQFRKDNNTENISILKEYLHVMKLRGRAKTTLESYELFLKRFIKGLDKPIKRVNTRNIRSFLMQEEDKGNSKSTIATKISILKSYFNWLEREEIITKNPVEKIEKPKFNNDKPKHLTYEEIERIRDLDMKLIDKVLFEVLYSSGIRVSEAVNLDWEDIDFDNRQLYVKNGKGSKDRTTLLSVKSIYLLKKYKRLRKDSDKCVFRSNYRQRMSKESIERHIRLLGEKSNLRKRLYPHRLRHSCATHLLSQGLAINNIQKLLGHSKVTTTERYSRTNFNDVDYNYKRINL